MSDRKHGEREAAAPARRKRHRLSPLTWRILAINIAALLIPVASLLYLGPYRDGLIESELESLRTQGETFAGAIGEGAIEITTSGRQLINLPIARQIVWRLSAPTGIRARLFVPSGELIGDSRYLMGTRQAVQIQELPPPTGEWTLDSMGFLIDWFMNWMPDRRTFQSYKEKRRQSAGDYAEVVHALAGNTYGMVRENPSGGLILSVAVPVQRYRQVIGALMVSKSDAAIKTAISEVRITVIALFGAALVVTILLSLYLSGTIARPVLRLAAAAERVRRGLGRGSEEIPDFTRHRDEIGELSGVLREMTDVLHQRMEAIERFAADVSHEIKNPLTSLRSAVETAARLKDPGQQRKLMSIIEEDVERLDRLITDISNASRLDAELSRAEAEPVDLEAMLATLCEIHRTSRDDGVEVDLEIVGDATFRVLAMPDRLVQVFRNLLENAISFSPAGSRVTLRLSAPDGEVRVTVEDHGRGLPEGKLEAVFDRFYSERPEGEKFGTHSGLGLSISKQIVEAHGGTLHAENRLAGDGTVCGARFIVCLPGAGT